ncbi:MAG: hypothetical protein WCJ35_00390 [Planctomycetota bacterium]
MAVPKDLWTPAILDSYLAAPAPIEWVFGRLRQAFDDVRYRQAIQANSIPAWLLNAECEAAALEMSLVAAGGMIYDEFLQPPPVDRDIGSVLQSSPCCVLLLDGLSLREIPEILDRAAQTPNCSVTRITWALAATPADTTHFRQQRLQMGGANITQLATPMSQLGVTYRVQRSQVDILEPVSPTDRKVFVWSQFPDATFGDESAKHLGHFTTTIVPGLRQVWNNVLMRLGKRRIIITSDHGYLLRDRAADSSLGPELWEVCPAWNPSQADQKTFRQRFNQIFGGGRFVDRELTQDELSEIPDRRIIKTFQKNYKTYTTVLGRFFWRAGGAAFDHDGLSLLENIVPWIELEIG